MEEPAFRRSALISANVRVGGRGPIVNKLYLSLDFTLFILWRIAAFQSINK